MSGSRRSNPFAGSKRRGRRASHLHQSEMLSILRVANGDPDAAYEIARMRWSGRDSKLLWKRLGSAKPWCVTFIPWNNGKPRDVL